MIVSMTTKSPNEETFIILDHVIKSKEKDTRTDPESSKKESGSYEKKSYTLSWKNRIDEETCDEQHDHASRFKQCATTRLRRRIMLSSNQLKSGFCITNHDTMKEKLAEMIPE